MPLFRERTTNSNNEAALTSVALNASTSIKIADACTNGCRVFLAISNKSSQDVWIKLQPASTDNDKKGIFLPKKSYWEMPIDNIYIGEVSSISETGTPTIYITEY